MKSKNSITADEKKLLDYIYEKANDIADYCHRNNMIVPVSISIRPDYPTCEGDNVYDYRNVCFYEDYESGNTKRIVSLGYNFYTDKAEYRDTHYEDIDE